MKRLCDKATHSTFITNMPISVAKKSKKWRKLCKKDFLKRQLIKWNKWDVPQVRMVKTKQENICNKTTKIP